MIKGECQGRMSETKYKQINEGKWGGFDVDFVIIASGTPRLKRRCAGLESALTGILSKKQ